MLTRLVHYINTIFNTIQSVKFKTINKYYKLLTIFEVVQSYTHRHSVGVFCADFLALCPSFFESMLLLIFPLHSPKQK